MLPARTSPAAKSPFTFVSSVALAPIEVESDTKYFPPTHPRYVFKGLSPFGEGLGDAPRKGLLGRAGGKYNVSRLTQPSTSFDEFPVVEIYCLLEEACIRVEADEYKDGARTHFLGHAAIRVLDRYRAQLALFRVTLHDGVPRPHVGNSNAPFERGDS